MRNANAETPDALALLNASNTETAESDDAGTMGRCDLMVIKAARERKYEVGSHEDELRKSTIYRVASNRGTVAQVFLLVQAIPAVSVDPSHPTGPNASPIGYGRGAAFDHVADDLVPRNEWRV